MEIDYKAECLGGDLVESLASRCGELRIGGSFSARQPQVAGCNCNPLPALLLLGMLAQ